MQKEFENKTIIYESVWKTITLTVFSGLFVIGLFISDIQTKKPLLFWVGIGLFGFGLIQGFYKLLNPKNIFLRPGSPKGIEYQRTDFERKFNDNGIFVFNQNGFKVNLDQVYQYLWTDISVIIGYKKDLYTIDIICLDIFMSDGKGFSINEDTPGWHQFLIKSEEKITEIPKNWEIKIASPAFETNLTLLYDKNNRNLDEVTKDVYK